jgi:hypothetical protein
VADDTITTVLTLDLDPYRKSLEELPKDTQKALKQLEREAIKHAKDTAKLQARLSKKTASEVSKHARDQARAAKKAARDTERAYDEQFTSIMALAGAAFGGVAGDAEDLAITLGGISGPMAAIGVALGALAIGPVVLGGMATAARGLADSGAEALGELREMGPAVAALVSADAQAGLDEYTAAMARLELAARVASAELGGALGPELAAVATALLRVVVVAEFASDAIATVKGASSAYYDAVKLLSNVIPGTTAELTRHGLTLLEVGASSTLAATDTEDLKKKIDVLTAAMKEATAEEARLKEEADKLAQEERDAATAAKKWAAEQKALADAAAKEADAIAGASEAMKTYGIVMQDTMGTGEQVVAFNLALVESDAEVTRSAEEKAEAYAAAMEKMGEAMRYVQGIGGEAANALAGFSNLAMQGAEREAAAKKKSAKNIGATIKGLEKQREAATGAELVRIQERIYAREAEQDNMRKLAQKANKRALAAWKAAKAAQISATIMNGISAGIAFLAPPPMGLGPVAGSVAAGLLAGGVTAAVAEIAATKPPKFHQGGIVAPPRQEVGALLETGEGVIRREAMMQPGAAETVERMNEGGAAGGQPMAVYLNDRLVDVLIARAERTDAQSRRGLAMVGTRTMYDRRR